MGESKVHLVVPGFVDGGKVLCDFLDEGHEDETHEGVGNVALFDDERDFLDEENRVQGNAGEGDSKGNNTFCEGELILFEIDVTIAVFLLVGLKHAVEEAVVGAQLEEDVDAKGNEEDTGCDAGDVQDVVVQEVLVVVAP